MGFVFQSYGLVPLMTVEENIEFGLRIAGIPRNERTEKIKQSIELVGLSKRLQHRPFELSGGEQKRVAIARAIATNPSIIRSEERRVGKERKNKIYRDAYRGKDRENRRELNSKIECDDK